MSSDNKVQQEINQEMLYKNIMELKNVKWKCMVLSQGENLEGK